MRKPKTKARPLRTIPVRYARIDLSFQSAATQTSKITGHDILYRAQSEQTVTPFVTLGIEERGVNFVAGRR